jgi:hypothetical protein
MKKKGRDSRSTILRDLAVDFYTQLPGCALEFDMSVPESLSKRIAVFVREFQLNVSGWSKIGRRCDNKSIEYAR